MSEIIYRLHRRCQNCHNGRHDVCEGLHYASPAAPRVECECQACLDNDRAPHFRTIMGAGYAPCGCELPITVTWSKRLITCDHPRSPYFRGNRKAVTYAA